jgi:hypothetical protein
MGIEIGDVSPLAGMISGKGLMGELAAKGAMGLLPRAIAKDAYADEEEKRKKAAGASSAPATATMKKGGKVSSASKRADGIATKGKTRGTMITMKTGGYAC